jgi:hypothetical protein
LAVVISYFPAICYSITRQKRLIAWAASFFLCFLLGSGGTTPLPIKLLGANAFNILTLDRFGFWASVIAIPFIARFIYSFLGGAVRDYWVSRFNSASHFLLSGILGFSYFVFIIFVFHLGSFRPLQPKEIEIQPLINFLNRDDHMRWRFLTLGFGDQMAWLSANSMAASVDGNYHSARRLPELTTRPVERLENAKYNGEDGLASLRDFLTKSEKYSLKYVFSNDRYYDPLLFFTGWSRVIQLENGIMVWEKGNIPTIVPVTPKKVPALLKRTWGIIPVTSLCLAVLLSAGYLYKYKSRDYVDSVPVPADRFPPKVIIASVLLPICFFTTIMAIQIHELLFVDEQKDPETTVLSYYNHLDFQRFEKAFHFFKPSYTYTLDQYLLEKSVNEGGLLPSYAKLDSIHVQESSHIADTAVLKVYTRWRTSLGLWDQNETMTVEKAGKSWFIVPPVVRLDMAKEQMKSYHYLVFKKLGKRVISSFPSVKDDRVKRPFTAVKQASVVRRGSLLFVVGEILNADDIPVNLSVKIVVHYDSGVVRPYYPTCHMHYNLSPKASTYFEVQLDSLRLMDSLCVQSVEMQVKTDVSERGYIHGGTIGYSVENVTADSLTIHAMVYNELTTELNVPALLVAEKDRLGNIWQVDFKVNTKSVRTGLTRAFDIPFRKVQGISERMDGYPLAIFVDGQPRSTRFVIRPDEAANRSKGLAILPDCFIASEIYLQ